MASNEQEEPTVKQKLSKLSCPFTWEMLDISVIKHRTIRSTNDLETEDSVSGPLELLINSLFECYMAVISADNDKGAKIIQKSEEILMQLQEEQKYLKIIKAIEHVFYATKCFFLYETEKTDELEEILENIDTEKFTDEESAALYGCQSVVWSSLNDFGMEKAIDTAEKAVEKNQDCALWHFILAKNLRRRRRMISLSSNVSEIEKKHFEIAYAISKNHVFGIYYLQMRLECFYAFSKDYIYRKKKLANEKQVLEIAKDILKSKPTDYKVLLKLTRIFLRIKSSDERQLAKECLDGVQKIAPNNATYLHYSGLLHEQSGDYKEALKYFKKAADCNNFVAEIQYIQCGWEIGELEPLPHVLRMLKKYNESIKERQIIMLLNIAITYYSQHNDIRNAATYFLKALKVDPLNQKFKVYYKFLDFQTPNISSFLLNQFCPRLETHSKEISQEIRNLLRVSVTANLMPKFESLSIKSEKNVSS